MAVRQSPELQRTSEDPVFISLELRVLIASSQDCEKLLIERHEFKGAVGPHIVHDLIYDSPLDVEPAIEPINIAPFESQEFKDGTSNCQTVIFREKRSDEIFRRLRGRHRMSPVTLPIGLAPAR